MRRTKKIGLVILIALIGIQFIQPGRNGSEQVLPTDISKTVSIPRSVQSLLQSACYDCHSNNTYYPWYTYVQPIGWMLSNHIQKGKKDLNFSEFGAYSDRQQQSKLKSIASQIEDDEMPLASYTFLHKSARLIKEQKALIVDWALNAKDSIEQNKP